MRRKPFFRQPRSRTPPRAAGVSPPGLRDETFLQRNTSSRRSHFLTRTRAAFVPRSCFVGRPSSSGGGIVSASAVLHTTGGSHPPLLVLRRERWPAQLRLLRCTNAGAQGAAGVSPPGLRDETFLQRNTSSRRSHFLTRTRAAFVPRSCFVGRPSSSGGGIVSASAVLHTTGGSHPPLLVLRRERWPAQLRLLRCTNAGAQERRA